MRISSISQNMNKGVQFGDALSSKQERAFKEFQEEDKRTQGYHNGITMAKFYIPSLPSNSTEDTGIGKINSKEAERAYEIANIYYNANAAKIMPIGQLTDKTELAENNYPGAYNRSALSIGEDVINLFDLASDKWGNILPEDEAQKFVQQHQAFEKEAMMYTSNVVGDLIDFETTLGWKSQEDYPINDALQIAFENFKTKANPNNNLQTLRKEFEEFKHQKHPVDYDDIYTRLALFPYLKDWPDSKVDFFKGFDAIPHIRAQKMPQYEAYKEQYKDEIEFYKFKQFIAHKTLQEGKQIINSKGMDAIGDCIIGFSWPERQMFPDAFLEDAEVGWGLPAINFHDLIDKNDSAAHRLLRAKVSHYLSNYDGIRFDVGWQYMNPCLIYDGGHRYKHLDAGNKITDFIEQIARDVKGNDFDQRKLMYECDAGYHDFPIQDEHTKNKLRHMQGMAILSTVEEENDNRNVGWGNASYIRQNLGLHDDKFILGTNNHDRDGVLSCAKDKFVSNKHVGALMRVFNLRPQDGVTDGWKLFKDDNNFTEHIRKYIRARFAEISTVKHKFAQFYDILGREEKTDYHTGGNKNLENHQLDYKNRLEGNYEENFHRALQDGVGYNAADVIKFRMEHDGSRERHPELYEKACKYAAYLSHKGGIYTREQANNSNRADLDIESMSLDEIQNM